MPTLYIIQQNTILRKQGQRLLLCKRPPYGRKNRGVQEGDIVVDLPLADVDHVMVFGNIQISTQALQQMLKKGIECALFSYSGKLLGQITPPLGRNIRLRARQYELFTQKEFRLMFSKQLVAAKIRNAQNLVRRFRKNNPKALPAESLKELSRFVQKASRAESLDSLLGIEGSAAAVYFKLFRSLIKGDWQFDGRTRRPPKDEVNAVLSFGYVVAGSRIQALLDGMGFDPFLGIYHKNAYGRASLALDLLEEFRQPLVDRLAMRLFNQNIMSETDFFNHATGGIYLNGEGKRKFFLEYERSLGEIAVAQRGSETDVMSAIQKQIRRLMQTTINGEVYHSYEFKA